jgi:hypothetical protein
MSDLLKLNFRALELFSKGRGSSILGLWLDGSRLDGVKLRRTNGSAHAEKTFSLGLSLDPLTAPPELVGREIRNLLEKEGVRERRCVVGLPLKWALTFHTQIPDLPEGDIASFLQIEAERGFPCDPATLMVATSRYRLPSGQKHATLIGIPRSHVELLERVLHAAQLKPLSFTLAITALQPPDAGQTEGLITLALGETRAALQVSYGGGVAALRALEGAIETEGAQRKLNAELVARETRITLAQLPEELRQAVVRVRIFGPRDLAQELADEIDLRLEALGLQVEMASTYKPSEFAIQVPRETPISPAFSLAARAVGGQLPAFEFLPPKVSVWQQFGERYSSGKLQRAGLAAALVLLIAGGAFGVQQWQLWRLQFRWNAVKSRVTALRDVQKRTAQFRPWHNESLRTMTILRRLTEAFPEDGSVTAKVLEIREPGIVTCTGTTRDYQALLKTIERLRSTRQIPDVNLGPTRGQSPALQFTFNFLWNEGGASAN